MSHLGELISALVDGELDGAELDRVNAHLAACAQCRAEAAALRQLKRELRALAATPFDLSLDEIGGAAAGQDAGQADEALTRRLIAMAGPGGPVPSRRARREQYQRAQRNGRPGNGPVGRGGAVGGGGPMASRRPRADGQAYAGRPPHGPRRGRYLVWSAVSLVVVGIGAAAFGMGGSTAAPGPKITPQLEMFSVEHAITSGDVPFPDPTQSPTATP